MYEQPFIDYYEALQISPNADFDTIERVYRLLAKKYHPDNQSTGDIEKFESFMNAYKTLSDPEKRAGYDAIYDEAKSNQWKRITNAYAAKGFEADQHLRRTILSILYTKKREDPSSGGVGIVQLETLMQQPGGTLNFHIWYLKEKALISRTDSGSFEITAMGVDQVEASGYTLREDRLLTESTEHQDESEKNPALFESYAN